MEEKDVKVTFPGGVRVQADYKGFKVLTDQPAYAGGEGSAPSPFDLFLVSLATCAGYFVVAFCRERGIPIADGGVALKVERNPETRMIAKIAINIDLPAGFPEKYRNAVVKAADICTVKSLILNPPVFAVTAEIRK
jgi:putative redox protein